MIRRATTTGIISQIAIILWLGTVLLIEGCSDQRAVSQLPDTHPASWMVSGSPDFHGTVALQNGSTGCTTCHGADFLGGSVGVSCVDCHLSSGTCVVCHGGRDSETGAPPYGLHGEISDTALAVGAHTAHLAGTPRSAAVACQSCHLVPVNMLEITHLDIGSGSLDSIAEIIWQGIADGGGAVWDRSSRICSGTYCHGNFNGGDSTNSPIWTASDQALCGSCHDIGDDPASLGLIHQIHVTANELVCSDCHAAVVDSSLTIIAPASHVNGVVEVSEPNQGLCDQCHGATQEACVHCHGGTDNQTGAPPQGLRGEVLTSTLAVGAHSTHLEGDYASNGFSCHECHVVPTRLTDEGHWAIDSVADISWGTLAGNASQWNRGTGRCGSVYCHGNFSGGSSGNAPIWNAIGQAGCGSCHDVGTNPGDLSGRHDKHVNDEGVECYECHAATVDASLAIIGKSVHVNGIKTVDFGPRQINYINGTCAGPGACHEGERWR